MTWRSPGNSWLRAFALLAASAAAGACGYDWTVRETRALDGGENDGAGAVDGGADAGAEPDAPGPPEAGPDASKDGAPSCAELASTMLQAANKAQSCALSSTQCQTGKILDECGCARFPAVAGSNDAVAWQKAIAAYKDANCLIMSCAGPCSAATSGVCVLQAGAPRCSP